MDALQAQIYFPEYLEIDDIAKIYTFVDRAIIDIDKNRNETKDVEFIKQINMLVKNSSVDIGYRKALGQTGGSKIVLGSISGYLLNALKLMLSDIKDTDEYKTKFDLFNTQFKTGN